MKKVRFQIGRIHRLKVETSELAWVISEADKLGMSKTSILVMRRELRSKKAKYMRALATLDKGMKLSLFKCAIKKLLQCNFLVKVKLEMKKGQDQISILI